MSNTRDVTPHNQFREVIDFILRFLRHPIQQIAHLPDWSWSVLLLTLVGVSIVSGVISGFVPFNIYHIGAGLILSPIVSLVMSFVMTVFFYYYFQIFENKTQSLRKIFTLIVFANIPFYIFQTAAGLVWVITPLAFSFTAFIMIVGLVENFQVDKKRAMRLVGLILAVVVIIWIWNRVELLRMH